MRLPNATHESHPWRIHAIVPDFKLEDVWALPVYGGKDDSQALLEDVVAFGPADFDSLPTRLLWGLRDRLGSLFGLGRISAPSDDGTESGLAIPGSDERSLAGRLPADLRGSAADLRFVALPFQSLYRTDDEFAAEISNQTVHAVMHLGWVERDDGRYQGRMAVYVKPRGRFGEAYMAAIKPFRYWIVYPALLRQIERDWGTPAVAR